MDMTKAGGRNGYDYTLIVTVAPDAEISKNAQELRKALEYRGDKVDVVTLSRLVVQKPPAFLSAVLNPYLVKLSKSSRVYFYGHGDWQNQTLGGVSPALLAKALIEMPVVRVVSLICCDAAIDYAKGESGLRVSLSADSFASHFHKFLADQGKKVTLYARTMLMGVRFTGAKVTSLACADNKMIDPKSKRPNSKVIFDWDGTTQRRRWFDYTTNAAGANLDPFQSVLADLASLQFG